MNRSTALTAPATRIGATTLAATALALIAALPVFAEPPKVDTNDTKSAQLRLADLDLSKAADVAIARERIHQIARTLCDRVEDPLSLSHQPDYVACVADAMAKAEPGLQRLANLKSETLHLAETQR
jgi:UrcA family protein